MEILEKLKHLEENIKILNEIRNNTSLMEVKKNKRFEWEIRYGLFESLQIVIDVSCKITSNYNLGNPRSYKECVAIDEEKLYSFLDFLDDFIRFIEEIKLSIQ